MPKVVDHVQRRRQIAGAVARIARTRGLRDVSFREVAAEAGVSVSLVQHYFGTKEQLLVATVNIQSGDAAARIEEVIGGLGPDPEPLTLIRVVAETLLPVGEQSRDEMLVYLGFGAAALTDSTLRGAEAFANSVRLMAFVAEQIARAQRAGAIPPEVAPDLEAHAIVALVVGLSYSILLGQGEPGFATEAIDAHLTRLTGSQGQRAATR